MADITDLKSVGEIHEGSSPSSGTITRHLTDGVFLYKKLRIKTLFSIIIESFFVFIQENSTLWQKY